MDPLDTLKGSVWHTTTPERYEGILESGSLLPEPGIPDTERWGTAHGPTHYPFVRSIGGVSLFDFRGFDEHEYARSYPNSMWRAFVPCSYRSDRAVWIRIDTTAIEKGFIDGASLLNKWKGSGQLHRKIMPLIEAAHIGPISRSAFDQVLVYDNTTSHFWAQ